MARRSDANVDGADGHRSGGHHGKGVTQEHIDPLLNAQRTHRRRSSPSFTGTLTVLPQRYERRGDATYWYEAPGVPYTGPLEVSPIGFIRQYPGLWEIES